MLGVSVPHSAHTLCARLFDVYPSLPKESEGKVFYCKQEELNGSQERIGNGFRYGARQMTVSTAADLEWAEKKYVLAGGELWRISSYSSGGRLCSAPSMLKSPLRMHRLYLVRVDDVSEVRDI